MKTSNLKRFVFYSDCVSYDDVEELNHIIDNSETITYKTFRKHVDSESFNEVKNSLGYDRELRKDCGLTLENDYTVSFHKSKTPSGELVYYFCHSAIEYVFKDTDNS